MERIKNNLKVELLEDTQNEDCHLAISVTTPIGEQRIYIIPVERRGGYYYVNRESSSIIDLLKFCNTKDFLRAIEDFNTLGRKIIL